MYQILDLFIIGNIQDDDTWFPQMREDYLKAMQTYGVTSVDYDEVVKETGLDWRTVPQQKLPLAQNMG